MFPVKRCLGSVAAYNHGPINHGLVKTITNNILPCSLSAYAVRIGKYSHSVDRR